MSINFKPMKIVHHLSEGEHKGVLSTITYFEEKSYFVLDISMKNCTFNTVFQARDKVFNNFACDFVDADGNFEPESIEGKEVDFTVIDNKFSSEPRSKITAISLSSEE